jgi:transposase
MKKITETPITTESTWEERALKAEAQVELLVQEIGYLRAQMRLLQTKQFGSRSEKTHKDQMQLYFNEAEASAEPSASEAELVTVPEHKRAKKKSKKGQSLEGLPENIIEHNLPEEELTCTCCGHKRHVIRQEITRELRYVPAEISVDVHVQNLYSCRHCESHGDGSTPVVVAAPKPQRAFPGSIASPSVVSHIIEEKYVKAVPLYRQEQQWERRGVSISRQNMSNWIMHAASNWLQPIYDAMKAELKKQDIIHADETSVQVLAEDGKKAQSKSFMWLYRSGRHGPGIVLYEYQPSRAREHPLKFLCGFKGYLASDGYAGYNDIPDVINVGCWAHARRGFDEAVKVAGKEAKNSKATEGLKFCNQLYAIERELVGYEPEERYKERLRRSKPVLEVFLAWLQYTYEACVQKSHLGSAIQYCLNQWESLNNFLLDGRLEIDNNRAERSIKPFVIGRKNFLFCITPRGANASAVTYSVIESAKENGLKPFEYIQYLLEKLPNSTSKDLAKFLPWSEEIPNYCRTPKKK